MKPNYPQMKFAKHAKAGRGPLDCEMEPKDIAVQMALQRAKGYADRMAQHGPVRILVKDGKPIAQ